MAGKTKNRRTGGSGSVFQDSKGRWHFRKDMGTDPATGRRRPPIEATGMVKSEARARFQAKIAEWERDGRLAQQGRPENRGLLRTVDGGAQDRHQPHHLAQRIQLDAHHERDHREHPPQPAHRRRHQRNVQTTAPHTQKQDRQHLSRSPRRHAPNRETGRTHRRRPDGKRRTNAGGPVRTPHPRRRRPSEGHRGRARRARSGGRRVRQLGRA